jgi:lipopolysaccharide transport system ATP-binding protein
MGDKQHGGLALSLRNVGVCYTHRKNIFHVSQTWAVHDITLDIHHGETLGIIGRNGAGKSTIMKLIAGIIEPDKGEVINYGDYTASLLVPQLGFISYLTGRENILLGGMLIGMTRKRAREATDDIIAFSEIGEFIDAPVETYSTGMKARLGFAVAVQADPDIILIDELLGVGDAPFKKKSAEAIKEKMHSNKTVVVVSHTMDTVKELCDRVVWIEKGETIAEGTPDAMADAYETKVLGSPSTAKQAAG